MGSLGLNIELRRVFSDLLVKPSNEMAMGVDCASGSTASSDDESTKEKIKK